MSSDHPEQSWGRAGARQSREQLKERMRDQQARQQETLREQQAAQQQRQREMPGPSQTRHQQHRERHREQQEQRVVERLERQQELSERQLEHLQRSFEQGIAATQERLQAIHDRFRGTTARGAGREHLIEVATVLFQSSGFADVSMQQIADAVGVTKAALYYHFRSKEDLFAVVVEGIVNRFWSGIIERANQSGPLATVLKSIIEYTTGAVDVFASRMMEDTRRHLSDEAIDRIFGGHPTPERELHAIFRRAIEAGEVRPLNVEVLAEVFVAMAMSLGQHGHNSRQTQPGDIDQVIDILLHGIAATSNE